MAGDLDVVGLIEVDPQDAVDPILASSKPPVDKTFRVFDPGQGLLWPPSLEDRLPTGQLPRFIAELVDEHLDLSRIRAGYTEGRGAPPYDPRLMVRMAQPGRGAASSRRVRVIQRQP